MAPNVCVDVVDFQFCITERRVAPLQYVKRNTIFSFLFSCPILFLDTFFYYFFCSAHNLQALSLYCFFTSSFSPSNHLLRRCCCCLGGFFFLLTVPRLVYIAAYILIFINLGGAIKIHILHSTHMRERRKALHENMAKHTRRTLIANSNQMRQLMLKNRIHIEMYIRTATIKQKRKNKPKPNNNKSYINAARLLFVRSMYPSLYLYTSDPDIMARSDMEYV